MVVGIATAEISIVQGDGKLSIKMAKIDKHHTLSPKKVMLIKNECIQKTRKIKDSLSDQVASVAASQFARRSDASALAKLYFEIHF